LCSSAALSAQDAPDVSVFGGLSILSVDGVQGAGWQSSVETSLIKNLGVVADVAGQYKFHVSSYQYLFGPQFTARFSKTALFAHALLGGIHSGGFRDSTNELALGLGGGIDINATERIAFRVIQADWIPNRLEGSWEKLTVRAGFGLVFKLAR
jgi:opacity protein-like surface antigen